MADENPMSGQELALRGVVAIEGVKSRLENVEKGLDKSQQQLIDHAELMKEVRGILVRIASAEEERTLTIKDAERERREENKRMIEQRSAWMSKLWANQAVQLLLMGLVMFILQLLGLSWMANKIGVVP